MSFTEQLILELAGNPFSLAIVCGTIVFIACIFLAIMVCCFTNILQTFTERKKHE